MNTGVLTLSLTLLLTTTPALHAGLVYGRIEVVETRDGKEISKPLQAGEVIEVFYPGESTTPSTEVTLTEAGRYKCYVPKSGRGRIRWKGKNFSGTFESRNSPRQCDVKLVSGS